MSDGTISGLVRATLLAALVICLLAGAGAGWAWHWYHDASMSDPHAAPTVVVIAQGDPVARVAQRLARAGVIEHPRLFRWSIVLQGQASRIQSGEYGFPAGASPAEVTQRLLRGDVVQHWVSLIEGHTLAQSVARLHEAPALMATLVIDATLGATVAQSLGLEQTNPEGLFFPDTYSFRRGDTDLDILRRAHQRLRGVLDAEWTGRSTSLPFETPFEALVLASVVEKETGRDADRAQIAQVFIERLRKGMRLQTDPTVIYGIGASFDGNLTRAHLNADTPYNTYTRRGLPPTPIALVGRASINAALHPATTDYLYFVARGDGSSEFSRTLAEHQRAVRRFQIDPAR